MKTQASLKTWWRHGWHNFQFLRICARLKPISDSRQPGRQLAVWRWTGQELG